MNNKAEEQQQDQPVKQNLVTEVKKQRLLLVTDYTIKVIFCTTLRLWEWGFLVCLFNGSLLLSCAVTLFILVVKKMYSSFLIGTIYEHKLQNMCFSYITFNTLQRSKPETPLAELCYSRCVLYWSRSKISLHNKTVSYVPSVLPFPHWVPIDLKPINSFHIKLTQYLFYICTWFVSTCHMQASSPSSLYKISCLYASCFLL